MTNNEKILKTSIDIIEQERDTKAYLLDGNSKWNVSQIGFNCNHCKRDLIWKQLDKINRPLFNTNLECPICGNKQILRGININST